MTGTRQRILVVDDEPSILETVSEFLALSGYDVVTATNGNEGLQAMHQHPPDLVLSDIMMPDVDGYQFYERIRQNPAWSTIPFIFMSAKGQQYDLRLGYGMGVDAYLIKPFDIEDLQIAVQSRLQRIGEIQTAARDDIEQMKQQLMTVFGHELRTPLTFIYGYLRLLQEDRDQLSDDDITDMLSGMERGAKRLMRLVEDLMVLMRIDSGTIDLEIKRYRAHSELYLLVADIVAAQSLKAAEQNVELIVDVPDDLIVYCVTPHLQDAVGRLLDNALKFSKVQGGEVRITGRQDGDQILLSVSDTGIGIDPIQQSNLFRRFQQVDRETMEQQGAGMGLAIASGLIQAHNGSISVESVPNLGSTFTISLPAVE